MKNFLRFIISILVVGVICVTVYYLVNINDTRVPVDDNDGGINNELEADDGENDADDNEDDDGLKDELVILKESIDALIAKNRNDVFKDYIDDLLDVDILGDMYGDFWDIFETDKLSASVRRTENAVFIIPTPDLLNSQEFYYYDDNTLAAYVIDFVGVGGQAKYYFNDNKLIDIVVEVEEEITIDHESEEEILKRAEKIFEKYLLNFRRGS